MHLPRSVSHKVLGAGAMAWRTRRRALVGLAALFVTFHLLRGAPAPAVGAESLAEAVVATLARRGLVADPASVHWVDEAPPGLRDYLSGTTGAVLARRRGELSDVYLFEARLSPEGRLLGLRKLRNLTSTSAVPESKLRGRGERLTWLVREDGLWSVEYADLSGDPPPESWSWVKRLQQSIADYQSTGRWSGVARRTVKLLVETDAVVPLLSNGELRVDAQGFEVRWPYGAAEPSEGRAFADSNPHASALPGNLVTWAVDRLRASPWVGNQSTTWLKAVVYDLYDEYMRVRAQVAEDEQEVIAEELRGVVDAKGTADVRAPQIGWPPEPLKPLVKPWLEGEGRWVPAHSDIVTLRNHGAPYPFVFTFLRTDPERIYSQISVILWDSRQVELHVVAGTQEPKSATGEIGTGMIPRDPAVMERLVGAFNGAFQAVHGQFGMMERDAVVLPPKPYGATVAEMRDGDTGFGTWPASAEISEKIVSLRQNMTPLVQDGVFNPYGRHWWGGLPDGWTEETRTVRSALCMTREGFTAYFYGNHADPKQLGRAMHAVRCTYGIHLDMNAGHTGFEFYRVARSDKPLLNRRLDESWEGIGPVPNMPGLQFASRLMLRNMPLMNFPRYVFRVSRDFFYLTLRRLLPADPLAPLVKGGDSDGKWRADGIPQHGWPLAAVETTLGLDPKEPVGQSARSAAPANQPATRARLVMVDPRMVQPSRAAGVRAVLTAERPRSAGTRALWYRERAFIVSEAAPDGAEVVSYGDALESVDEPRSMACTVDGGMLVFIELEGEPAGASALQRLLERVGCRSTIAFESGLGLHPGAPEAEAPETRRGGRKRLSAQVTPIVFERADTPGARRIFTETPVLPPEKWAIAQSRKVPYSGRRRPGPLPVGAAGHVVTTRRGE